MNLDRAQLWTAIWLSTLLFLSRVPGISAQEETPARIYLQYNEALVSGNLEALKGLVSRDRARHLDSPEAARMLALASARLPRNVQVGQAELTPETAVLSVTGTLDGRDVRGTVRLIREDGRWKVARESWVVDLDLDKAPPAVEPEELAQVAGAPLGHEGEVTALAFLEEDRILTSVSYTDGRLRVWALERGTFDQSSTQARVTTLVALPEQSAVLTGDVKGRVRSWPIRRGRLGVPTEIGTLGAPVQALAATERTDLVAVAADRPTVELWRLSSPGEIRTLQAPENVRSLAFSPDGADLVAGGYGRTWTLWKQSRGSGRSFTIPQVGAQSDAGSISFSPDGRYVATGHMDSSFTIWDVREGKQVRDDFIRDASTWAVRFSPSGDVLATAHQNGKVYLWRGISSTKLAVLEESEQAARSLAFGAQGEVLASGHADGRILLWERKGEKWLRLHAQARPLRSSDAQEPTAELEGVWTGAGPGGVWNFRFEGDQLEIRGPGPGAQPRFSGRFELQTAQSSSDRIRFWIDESSPEIAAGTVALGIYRLDGDELLLAGGVPGNSQFPESFDRDEQVQVFELKRRE